MIQSLFILFAAIAGFLLLARAFVSASPARLAQGVRQGSGAMLIAAAVGLAAFRQFALALPVAAVGFTILSRSGFFSGGQPSAGGASRVRSAGLEMTLDHDTGAMDGRVLAGRHEGRALSDLSFSDLVDLFDDFDGDPESLRLLEGYLDRAHPSWRDNIQRDGHGRSDTASGSFGMSAQEAYEILGISPGASEADIREAHRRLIKQVHPDRGGSAALAAKINEAKDRLIGRH